MSDAFGKTLFSYLKNKDTPPYIIRRDDNHIDKRSPAKYFLSYSRWPLHEKRILKFVRGRVLDIGAGAGRHTLWLQKKGLEVTAIDISPLAIKVMRERGVKKVKLMDVNKLNFPKNSFDTVLMMFNNFGLSGNIKNTKKLLKKLWRITSKKARIIATTRNPEKTKDPRHLAYHEQNRRKGKPIGQVRIRVEYKKYNGPWFGLLMLSPKELKEVIKETGWRIKKLCEGRAGLYGVVLAKQNA